MLSVDFPWTPCDRPGLATSFSPPRAMVLSAPELQKLVALAQTTAAPSTMYTFNTQQVFQAHVDIHKDLCTSGRWTDSQTAEITSILSCEFAHRYAVIMENMTRGLIETNGWMDGWRERGRDGRMRGWRDGGRRGR